MHTFIHSHTHTRTALHGQTDLATAQAHLHLRLNKTDLVIQYLKAYNGASTSQITDTLPDLWKQAHYMDERHRLGRDLTAVDRLLVRR